MTDERILCDCGCDAPERQAPRWPLVVSGVLMIVVGVWLVVGCAA